MALAIVHQDELVDELAPSCRGNRERRALSDEEKVELCLSRGYGIARIIRTTRISPRLVRELVDKVDQAKIREVAEGDEVAKARQISYHEAIAAEAWDAYRAYFKKTGKRNLRLLKVGMEAERYIREIRGLNAPTKQVNLNLTAKPLVHPAEQQAMINADPDLRRRWVELNAERRALAAQIYSPGGGGGADG